MKIPNLQLTEITEALEDHGEHSWYWDKKAGEVLLNSDYDICGVSLEEQGFDEEPDENPDRYIYIEPLDSHQGFRNMEHYVGSLPEGECQRSLIRALRGRGPFASFKDTLHDFPDERQAWFAFHNDWLAQKAIEFIQANELGEVDESTTKPPNP
jgi:hypothetical protein